MRRFQDVANNVNKRLLCHRFFTLPVPAKFVDLSKFAAKVRLFFDIRKENRIFFWSLAAEVLVWGFDGTIRTALDKGLAVDGFEIERRRAMDSIGIIGMILISFLF